MLIYKVKERLFLSAQEAEQECIEQLKRRGAANWIYDDLSKVYQKQNNNKVTFSTYIRNRKYTVSYKIINVEKAISEKCEYYKKVAKRDADIYSLHKAIEPLERNDEKYLQLKKELAKIVYQHIEMPKI